MKLSFVPSLLFGSQYIIQQLIDNKIDTIFGYSGGSNLALFDQLYNHSSFKLIVNRNEQSSGFSAIGYSKSSGYQKIPLLLTTSGPGLTNVITPLQDAHNDGVPLLCISGQVSKSVLGTRAFQEVDAISLTKTCTQWNYQIQTIDQLEYALEETFRLLKQSSSRKGPIHLDICSNVFSDSKEFLIPIRNLSSKQKKMKFFSQEKFKTQTQKSIFELAKKINQSKKPIFIIGQGNNDEYIKLRNLSKTFKIPVTTTLHAVGNINEKNPLSLKMLGMHGTVYANKLVQEADLIVGIGNRFDDRTFGNAKSFGFNAKQNYGIYHINVNEPCLQIAQKLLNTTSIKCNSQYLYRELFHHLQPKNRTEWLRQISHYKSMYPLLSQSTNISSKKELSMEIVLHSLDQKLQNIKSNQSFKITTGVGSHQMKTAQCITWTQPYQLLTSGSLGTMGVGIGYAIGASLANPNDLIFNIDGDGSFMMSLQELGTIQEYQLPIKIILLNNQELNMIRNWQELFYSKRYIAQKLKNPNYKYITKAYGIPYFKCEHIHQLNTSLDFMFHHKICFIEYKVKSEQCLPFVPPNYDLNQTIYL